MRTAIVTLLLAAGLAGCGADPERQTASGALQRAGEAMRDDASVRFRTTMNGRLGDKPTSSHGNGVMDIRGRRIRMTAVATIGEDVTPLEIVAEEYAVYSRCPRPPLCPGGAGWQVHRTERHGGIGAEAAEWGSRDPTAQLAMLAMATNVGRIGTEKVGGVLMTRFGGEVNGQAFDHEPIDFWVDEQWRIRRLRTVTTRAASDGVPERRETNTTEFYDYSAAREPITVPRVK